MNENSATRKEPFIAAVPGEQWIATVDGQHCEVIMFAVTARGIVAPFIWSDIHGRIVATDAPVFRAIS